jgi:hypothetical protein
MRPERLLLFSRVRPVFDRQASLASAYPWETVPSARAAQAVRARGELIECSGALFVGHLDSRRVQHAPHLETLP